MIIPNNNSPSDAETENNIFFIFSLFWSTRTLFKRTLILVLFDLISSDTYLEIIWDLTDDNKFFTT